MRYFLHIFRSVCPIFFLIWSSICLSSQTPAYLHYDVGDGLPGNIVYCAAQDERGFMWFGTDKGLACFDGTRFRTFGVKEGLPDPEVLNLKLDSRGRLWIFCFKQKPCFFFKGRLFTEKNTNILNEIELTIGIGDILEDADKNIWCFGQGKNIYFIDRDFKKVSKIDLVTSASFLVLNNNQLIGCDKKYFSRISSDGYSDLLPLDKDLSTLNYLGSGGGGQKDEILISFSNSTYLVCIKKDKCMVGRKILDAGGRVSIRQDHIWICTTSHGAIRFSKSDSLFQNPVYYLQNKKVSIAFEDSQKGIWLCTVGEGIYYLPVHYSLIYTQENGLLNNNITALASGFSGEILGGDDQGNIYKFVNGVQKVTSIGGRGLNRCRQIFPLKEDKILIISDIGLTVLQNRHVFSPIKKAGKYLVPIENGWLLGTATDLSFIHEDSITQSTLIFRQRVTMMARDEQGYIWVGGINGLFSSKDNFTKNLGDLFPSLKNRIVSIKRDVYGRLWIATANQGLLCLVVNGGDVLSVEEITPKLKVKIENIQSLFIDDKNRVWLATNKGVFGIDKDFEVIHFDKNNGLVEDDVNDILVRNDTLWVGTVGGLSQIVMANYTNSNFSTYITKLKYRLDNQLLDFILQDTFSLSPLVKTPSESSLFELELAGLDYSSRGNMQYLCIIKQYLPPLHLCTFDNLLNWAINQFDVKTDTTYVTNGNLNLGVYLAPGVYLIEAIAVRPNGLVSKVPAICRLEKPPHWYQTIWFYLMVLAFFIYILFKVVETSYQNRKLQIIISELKLQALQLQINPHFIGNSINAIQQFFFPPDPSVASEYIATFTRLLRTTMDYSERPFVSLSEELSYDEDYLKMIQLRFDKRFYFTINVADGVDMETLFPTMLLQPVLENSTIHGLSPKNVSLLEIVITLDQDEMLTCTVTDNGVGVNQAKKNKNNNNHQSHGISLIERKITSLNDLYHFECKMEINDRSDIDPNLHGTQMKLTFYPKRILKIKQY